MSARKKIIIGLFSLVALMAAGGLFWAVKTGKITPRADTTTTNPPQFNLLGQFSCAETPSMAIDSTSGNIFVASTPSDIVQVFDSGGQPLYQIGKGYLTNPFMLALDNKSGNIYVSNNVFSSTNNKIVKFNSKTGAYISTIGYGSSYIFGMAIGSNSTLYVATGGTYLDSWTSAGVLTKKIYLQNMSHANRVAIDSSGRLLVTDSKTSEITTKVYDLLGNFKGEIGKSGGTGTFSQNTGVAVDATDRIFITDNSRDNIQVFDKNLAYLTQIVATPPLSPIGGIAVSKDGKVYFSDGNSNGIDDDVIKIFGQAQNRLSGTVKGQDSDSETQIPVELAKVKVTINGKAYAARTDKDGKYTLDFSDQATLPADPVTVNASSDDSYGSQDQQVTVALNQTVTKDFVLGREISLETIPPDSTYSEDLDDNWAIPQVSADRGKQLIQSAKADTNPSISGQAVDLKTARPIAGVKVILKNSAGTKIADTLTDISGYYKIYGPLTDDVYKLYAYHDNGHYRVFSDFIPIQGGLNDKNYFLDIYLNSNSPSDISYVKLRTVNPPTLSPLTPSSIDVLNADPRFPRVKRALVNRVYMLQNNLKNMPKTESVYIVITNDMPEAVKNVTAAMEFSSISYAGVSYDAFYVNATLLLAQMALNITPSAFDNLILILQAEITHEYGHLVNDRVSGWSHVRSPTNSFYNLFDAIKPKDPSGCGFIWQSLTGRIIDRRDCYFVPISHRRDGYAGTNEEEFVAEAFTIVNDGYQSLLFLRGPCESVRGRNYKCYNEGPKNFSAFSYNLMATWLEQKWKVKGTNGVEVPPFRAYDINRILQGDFRPLP